MSAHALPPSPDEPVPVRLAFPDWIPGLCSTLGMIIVNLIDKSQLTGDDDDNYGGGAGSWGGGVAWRARLFLFMGFALMAGGLAGSVVRRCSCWTTADGADGTRDQVHRARLPRRVWRQLGAEQRRPIWFVSLNHSMRH